MANLGSKMHKNVLFFAFFLIKIAKKMKKELAFVQKMWSICIDNVAGWSSMVARQAHNLKVIGSNPIPASNFC